MIRQTRNSDIILIVDPRILAMPVVENHEALIDLRLQSNITYGPSPEIPDNIDYTFLRESVYLKLIEAQNSLPNGWRFCLYEGYRSLSLQKMLYDTRYAKIQKKHPEWSPDQVYEETIRLVSPVINQDGSANVPPHSTGGAVDVYLLDEQDNVVDMGMHPKDWMDDVDGTLSQTDSAVISGAAREHRKIMSDAMTAVGFINYPTEFWHWSYGDRYWAYFKNAPHAIYGSIPNN